MHSTETASKAPSRGGWLWVSAGVLAALIVVQGAGMLDSSAEAGMSSTIGSYTMITTNGGVDDILVVVDSSQESLMVYHADRLKGLQMLEREELSGLFQRARARTMGRP